MKRILAVMLALGFALVVSCASTDAAVVDAPDEDIVEMVEDEVFEEAEEVEEVEAAE